MARFASVLFAAISAFWLVAGATPASAGPAANDSTYFDGFLDLIGIDPYKSAGIELDALGGVRMKGNGAPLPRSWTSQADFAAPISYRPTSVIDHPPVPLATLDSTATPGSLVLPTTPYAFRRVSPAPVLLPVKAQSADGYSVAGMCVRRIVEADRLGNYYMWYTGIPDNEHTARIYLASSDDGLVWSRELIDGGTGLQAPVLDVGAPGSFDSRQLGKPSVVYDPAAPAGAPKFKMWYTAEGDVTGSIGYATSDDGIHWTKWVQPVVTLDGTDVDVGQHAALAVGTDGLPIVAYYDATNADLKFIHCGNAFCSAGNSVVTLDGAGDVGRFASLALAGDGLPVVAYYDATNGNLKLAHCGTAACMVGNALTVLDGATGADVGQYASLAVSPAGYPLVAYHDVTNGDLKFVGCNDFACAGGDDLPGALDGASGANVGQYASLALVARNPADPAALTPAIAYYDSTNTVLKYVSCDDALCAGAESPVTLDAGPGVGQYASLAVSPAGLPAVAYYDAAAGNLKFVACSDALCSALAGPPAAVDDDPADRGRYSRLAFGADGLPLVGYYDVTNGDVLMLSCNDALCAGGDEQRTVVDDAVAIDPVILVGRQLSLAVLPGGVPHLVYYDGTSGDLKFSPSRHESLPVLGPGIPGSIDSYSVAHPSVIYDSVLVNGVLTPTYRMWYTANDSNNRRIAYASSTDGVTWARGGLVIDLKNTANDGQGAWAPSVTKAGGSSYDIVYTGWKDIGGAIQAKLMKSHSADGTTWESPFGVVFSSGKTTFDDVSQGSILYDALDPGNEYKMWFVGNAVDPATGTVHDRIGYAERKGGSWGQVNGAQTLNAVLDLGTPGPAFDSMSVFDLRVVPDPANAANLLGFYTGRNAADFKDRIGVVQSSDGGATWTDHATAPAPLVQVGAAGTFDAGGVPTPAPVFRGTGSGWLIYHAALDASATPSIALHTAPDDLSSSSTVGQVTLTGGSFDAGGRRDPFVVAGAPLTLFYAGVDAMGVPSICMASGTADAAVFGTAAQILAPGPAGTYDAGGLRRPIVWRDPVSQQWQLWYTAIGADGVERIAHGYFNGTAWAKSGLALMPATAPHDFAEQGVWPGSAWTDPAGGVLLAFTGIDRHGWLRTGLLAASGPGRVDGATATFQTPADATLDSDLPRDWRAISWNPAAVAPNSGLEVWVSYYPTYSGLWSGFFKIDNGDDLPFLLTVKGVRWQVRATGDPVDAAVTPQLDDLTVDGASIAFPATATATTLPVGPGTGWYLLTWGDLTVKSAIPNGGTLSVRIADPEGTTIIPDQAVTSPEWVYTLDGKVPVTSGRLQLLFTFTPATGSTPPESPLLKSVNATFTSTAVPSALTLTGTPNPLFFGRPATLNGYLTSGTTPLQPVTTTIKLSKRLVTEATYTDLGTAAVVNGAFSLAGLVQTDDTIYRAEWLGENIGGTVYPPASATFLLQMAPATLTLRAATNPILYGKSTTLRGTLMSGATPLTGVTVALFYRLPLATTYTPLGTAVTDATGAFVSAAVAPKKNTVYLVSLGSKAGAECTLGVKTIVNLKVGGYAGRLGKYYRYPLGRSVVASGNVLPNHRLLGNGVTAGRVVIVVEKLTARTWKVYKRIGKALTSTSTYRHAWRPTLRARYRIRTTFAPDTDHVGGASVYRYVQVY